MTAYDEQSFALQRLYEKWVVKQDWLLEEEALPLLLGNEPGVNPIHKDYETLRAKAHAAIDDNQLEFRADAHGMDQACRVTPANIYNWARKSGIELPSELINLMEFMMKTVINTGEQPGPEATQMDISHGSDIERVLGACLAVVANYPDECKNDRGIIKPERVLDLVDRQSAVLFRDSLPRLSSTAIRDVVNYWVMKLR